MELRQLTYLDAVARHGSFTRAAEYLHVARPSVSVQVRRLEDELGVALLFRGPGPAAPTAAGEVFLVGVRRALVELDRARAELAEFSGRENLRTTP